MLGKIRIKNNLFPLSFKPMIIAIKGEKNSGKTAFIEKLLEKLQGYRVVVIKSSEHERIDKEGKDTFRHREAGAMASILLVKKESIVFTDAMDVEEAISFVRRKLMPDFIIIEGNKSLEGLKYRVVEMKDKPDVNALYNDMIKSLKKRRLEIFVDGKKIPMNDFVEDIFYSVIETMLSKLKGGEGREVEIFLHDMA